MKKMKMKRTRVEKLWKTTVLWKLLCKEDSLIEALATATSKGEEYVVETEPLTVPDSDALDETNSKD